HSKAARVLETVMSCFKKGRQLVSHCCRCDVSAIRKQGNRNQAMATWEEMSCANTFGLQTA
ncbi:MAG: hypothetical protein ABIZ09_20465, partial [Rhodoferax sp.]